MGFSPRDWVICCACSLIALECESLVVPPGVSVEECARRPVHGDMCVFRCAEDTSKHMPSRRVRSCEVKDYDTVYWTGQFPQCSGLCLHFLYILAVAGPSGRRSLGTCKCPSDKHWSGDSIR